MLAPCQGHMTYQDKLTRGSLQHQVFNHLCICSSFGVNCTKLVISIHPSISCFLSYLTFLFNIIVLDIKIMVLTASKTVFETSLALINHNNPLIENKSTITSSFVWLHFLFSKVHQPIASLCRRKCATAHRRCDRM